MSKPTLEQTLALILKKVEKIEKAVAQPKTNKVAAQRALTKGLMKIEKSA
jgi:hypothetical protein